MDYHKTKKLKDEFYNLTEKDFFEFFFKFIVTNKDDKHFFDFIPKQVFERWAEIVTVLMFKIDLDDNIFSYIHDNNFSGQLVNNTIHNNNNLIKLIKNQKNNIINDIKKEYCVIIDTLLNLVSKNDVELCL